MENHFVHRHTEIFQIIELYSRIKRETTLKLVGFYDRYYVPHRSTYFCNYYVEMFRSKSVWEGYDLDVNSLVK